MTPLKILIVEDSPDDAELLLRELRRGGFAPDHYVVDSAAAAAAALSSDAWDIIVSDFNLPRGDFPDIMRLAKADDGDRPFIILSGSIGEETAVALMREGAADLILKGNMSRLVPAIRRELAAAEQKYARRESERRFRDIVDISADSIWETDREHRLSFVSGAGVDAEWIDPFRRLGRTYWEAIGADPKSDPHWRNHLSDLEARRPFRSFRVSFGSPAGRRYHVSISGVPYFDRSGRFCGYRGAMTDETLLVEAYWRAEAGLGTTADAEEAADSTSAPGRAAPGSC